MRNANLLVSVLAMPVFVSILLCQPALLNAQTSSAGIDQRPDAQRIAAEIKATSNPPAIQARMMALSQLIADGTMTVEESAKIVRDTPQFYNSLIDVKSHADPLEGNAADDNLRVITLQWVILLNDLHGKPERFDSIAKSDSRQLYTLVVYTKSDIYTSSFMGVFKRLLQQMKAEGITGEQLLDNVGHNKVSSFVEVLVSYNRLNVFLGTMDVEAQIQLLDSYIGEIENDRDRIGRSAVIADAFRMIKNPELLQSMRGAIRERYAIYDAADDREGRAIFGLLAGIYGQPVPGSQNRPESVSNQYRLVDSREISIKKLFDQDGVCRQQYFFYGDAEGNSSFKDFIRQYKKRTGWQIVDKQTFVIVRSPVINGRRIEMYANTPGYAKEGCSQIRQFLSDRNIAAVVGVHRGHSYQAFETLKELSPDTLLMYWGSCEGYRESINTFTKCPRLVGLICTRGITYAYINEIILQKLNNELLKCKTGSFNLDKYWQKVENDPRLKNDSNFSDFVDPSEDYGVRLRRTLARLGIDSPAVTGATRSSQVER